MHYVLRIPWYYMSIAAHIALPHYDIPKMEGVTCILTACRTNQVT